MRSLHRLAVLAALPALAAFTQPPVSPEHTLRYTRERGGSVARKSRADSSATGTNDKLVSVVA